MGANGIRTIFRRQLSPKRFPVTLALVYVLLGVAWIGLSDEFVARSFLDTVHFTPVQELKGWAFVFATGLLLYALARRAMNQIAQASRSLQEERDFNNSVLNTADALVIVLDRAGNIVRFNRACERMSDYTAEQVLARPVWEVIVPEEETEGVKAVFQRLVSGETPVHYENHVRGSDGRRRLVAWSNTVLTSENGEVRYVIATGIDITRQRAMVRALRASEERYHRMMETANDAIIITDADSGTIIDANRGAEVLLGRSVMEIIGHHQSELHPPEERERCRVLFQDQIENRRSITGNIHVMHSNGRRIPVEISASVTRLGGTNIVQGIFRDVSERLKAEEELRKLSRVVEASPSAIVITDAAASIEYCNPKFYETTGYSPEEVIGENPRILKSGETPTEEYQELWGTLRSGKPWYGEFHNRKKNGQLFWWLSSITPIKNDKGEITHFVNIAEDIGRLKYAEHTIRTLAYYDPLTKLPNRTLFKDRLGQALASTRHYGESLGLMFVDIDRFKTVNDALGHVLGDELLRTIAQRLQNIVEEGMTLARLGGDEFALILPGIKNADEAVHVVQRLFSALTEPFVLDGHELYVTASVGITLFPDDAEMPEALIANADLAMFRAKDVGRNTYQFFTSDMNASSFEQLNLELSLRRAVAEEQFEVYFQPKMRLADGTLTGMEALVRWRHPDLGLVSPARFIPLAEETGLILPIGEWVLMRACEYTRGQQEAGHAGLRVSVNLSARQFRQADLPDRVASILDETGLAPDSLELEITESDIMRDAGQAVEQLYQFKAMGVHLSIDDFGTGYSSLNYLKRFPIDVLKVDQSFTRDVTVDPDDATIARAVIALAHSMRLSVVAEGVETEEHLDFFRAEGCDEAQGFLLGRPMPEAEFSRVLQSTDWPERWRHSG
jgi:diguanylate cyclase (GGDEF)-like protein/PAS domain S-box-containing protein